MGSALQRLLAMPRLADAPTRVWQDWFVVAAIVIGSTLEALLRDDVAWPIPTLIVGVAVAASTLWRRARPLLMTLLAFGTVNVLSLAIWIAEDDSLGIYSMAWVLVVPYALFRWGSGRDAVWGSVFMAVAWLIGITTDPGTVGDAIGGLAVLLVTAALGVILRYESIARQRRLDDVKVREREQLARELHDTVAHHVSAIAVQAQAGRTVAATQPQLAVDALTVIEEAASRTLVEMRAMVGALRDTNGEVAELAPQQRVADLHRLAQTAGGSLSVAVDVADDLGPMRDAVDAAIYRIAQESVTNAVRHARNASRVDVSVAPLGDCVELTVTNDGDRVHVDGGTPTGFGLLGMTERAKLLGGSLTAGPETGGGWTIVATLPRSGVRP